ncbi:MAG: head-tail adaptor protein [Alphaproteobacteria bacterium]|nr:MAG: head-tail adaptor protein [Alphaproteobacteria bacterium]
MVRPRLTRLLTLEEPVAVADTGGGEDRSWQALGALWAEVKSVSGGEVLAGGRERTRISHRIVVRGAPEGSPRRPAAQQRFREGTRIFGIRAVSELDPEGFFLVCWCEEGAGE